MAKDRLVIVLSSMQDPLADRSRPTKPIDLTLSGQVVDAEPSASSAGARAKPPAPALSTKALPPGPVATTAAALAQARTGKRTTPERVAKFIDNAGRLDARYWQGDCPVCRGARALTWTANAEGRAASFDCQRGCPEAEIIAALKRRAAAASTTQATDARHPPKLPRALRDAEGEDMEMMHEPEFLPEVPRADD